jgi:CheY-like chemotaxis protein
MIMALCPSPLYRKASGLPTPSTSINTSRLSALLVENDRSLLRKFLMDTLEDKGYTVRTASNTEEGLRLYCDCAPFSVVLIEHCVPRQDKVKPDYCKHQTGGIELAMAILKKNWSQRMILMAFDYGNADEVPRPAELMDIPLVVDIKNFQLQKLLARLRVHQAIEALSSAELLKLQKFAAFRIQGLGRAACGRTWVDLLQEAQLRTLIGAESTIRGRHWNKNVDFVRHLTGVMLSISSSWKRKFKEEAYLESEVIVLDAEGHELSPIDDIPSADTAADQSLIAKEKEDEVMRVFRADDDATRVLQGLLAGMKKNEIIQKRGISNKEYQAAMKRIRMIGKNGSCGGL